MEQILLDFGQRFIEKLPTSNVFNSKSSNIEQDESEFFIKKRHLNLTTFCPFFEKAVIETGLNPASGAHLGYIPGGGLFSSALGDFLAALTNRYAGVFYASPSTVKMENALIRWTGNLVGYKDGFGGNLT